MKLDELQNYCIKLTNHLRRFYYSGEPIINRNEIDYHEIKVGEDVGGVGLTEILKDGDEFKGVRFSYFDNDGEPAQSDATLEQPAKIKIITGNPERFFIEDLLIEIVPKDEKTIIGAEKIYEYLD